MSALYLPQFIALLVFAMSCAMTLKSDENLQDVDLLSDLLDVSAIPSDNCPQYPKPEDCAEVLKNGYKTSGLYDIYPRNKVVPCEKIKVYCDMKTDGGGWTVIQKRGDYKRAQDYFYKNWNEYKNGFGALHTDFWLGNDNIYALSNQKKYSVRFDLKAVNADRAYALYDTFFIENEELKYRLHISDYSGTAGDSMSIHHQMFFTTKDKDNDNSNATNCAHTFLGGWWYNNCHNANLNGLYWKGLHVQPKANLTVWKTWKGYGESLEEVEIKIRPRDFAN